MLIHKGIVILFVPTVTADPHNVSVLIHRDSLTTILHSFAVVADVNLSCAHTVTPCRSLDPFTLTSSLC